MIVKIVEKANTPPLPGDPFLVWSTENAGIESDPLDAAILSAGKPPIELGRWYPLKEAIELLTTWTPHESANNSIEIVLDQSKREKAIWSKQPLATTRFIDSIIEFTLQLHQQEKVWIRFD